MVRASGGVFALGNTAQFPPDGLSTAPADLRAKSRRKASVALRSASLRLGVRHGICVAKMLDNVGLRYPHRASGTKAPRTLRPLPLLRFAVSATGGAHLCSIQYYLRFWLSICRTSLAVSALRIMRYFHSVSTNAAGFCVKNSWNPQRIPAALCLKSCLCLRNIRHFLCFQIYLKKGYIPQVYLNRIYPYIVMRIEYLVKFTAWRALLWAKSRSTAPRPQ